MGKLKLSLDALRVTSFDTGAARAAGGTVHAHAFTTVSPCRPPSQVGCATSIQPCFSGPAQCTGPGCDETLAPSCLECGPSVDVVCW